MFKQLAASIFKSVSLRGPAIVSVRFQSIDYCSPKCDGITVEPKNQVLWVKFNRPQKLNAITREMYACMTDTFTKANSDKSIKAVVLTGEGEYYSSGNDLTNFALAMQHEKGPRAGLTISAEILVEFVNSLINLEKFLIAGVNGPALGISVTTLALCDYVIASDKSTFQTPFTALGQCPEACSSVTFPQIMGQTRANELLALNMTWDAKKAQNYGLVSDVIEHSKFEEQLQNVLYGKYGLVNTCYPHSLKVGKSLVRDADTKRRLLEVNKVECATILELWLGEECADAVQKFFKRSKR